MVFLGSQARVLPTHIRHFSSSPTTCALNLASMIQRSVEEVQVRKTQDEKIQTAKRERAIAEVAKRKDAKAKVDVLKADLLNDTYRSEFRQAPTPAERTSINHFFFQSKVTLDWMTFNFEDMLGEKERNEAKIQRALKSERYHAENEIDEENRASQVKEEEEPMQGFVKPHLTKGLPEVVFLGKCNVGKSTLLNALVSPTSAKKLDKFAFSSKVAGYTQAMNAFNIGNRLRIIDTPGYGRKGRAEQGRQVMDYIHNRNELRRVYLLIGAVEGFNFHDEHLLKILEERGIPFEIVFTKVDKLRDIKTVKSHIRDSGVLDLVHAPDLIFTGSHTNKKAIKRQGFTELRKSIFDACGYQHDLKSLARR